MLNSRSFDKKDIKTNQTSDPHVKCLSPLGDQLPVGVPMICLQKRTFQSLVMLFDQRGSRERKDCQSGRMDGTLSPVFVINNLANV